MQPKFTLRNLGSLFTKSFALVMLFVVSAHFAYSQQPNSARQKPTVASKPLTKLQLTEGIKVPVTKKSNNDAGMPNADALINAPVQTEAVCATFTGSLASGDQTMPLRMFRNGAAAATTCAAAGVFPGTAGAGPYFFDTYTWVNPQAVSQCVTVNLQTTDVVDANIQSAAYLTSFDPNSMATNYLGDPGVSTGIPAAAAGLTFAFNAPGNSTIVFVVFHTNPSGIASNYTLTVDGICTPCVPTAATAPTISSVPSTTCAGSPITLSILSGNLNGAADWKWYSGSCGGTLIGTGTSITVSPVATTTYFARGEGGCAPAPGLCGSQVVTVAPCTCISPDLATICAGSIQRLRINGTGAPASSGATSGAITVNIPDASAVGATHTIPVTLPAGATLTGVSVNFNMTHTWDSDMQINLKAPNGQVLNLVNQRGGSGDNFVNTTIAAGGASLATGTAPFTGTFAPDATLNVGPTGFASTATGFAQLLAVGDGDWVIAMRDLAGGDLGILTSWTLTFNYTLDPTGLWTGPAGTIFSNPAATVPYVTGTQANVVWVKPSTVGANTYTATLASGPCAGANNVTVTVLPVPVVTVSPNPGGCSPATLTASGASIYNWTPATGLNTTIGATVIATTPVNASYTVSGYAANGCAFAPVTVPVTGSSISAVISSLGAPPTIVWNEGFTVAAPLPAGWASQNLSAPVGSTGWFQGNTAVFPAQSGAATSYIGANFNNTAGAGTISNWLFTPVTTLANGDQLTFWTRTTDGTFPDRLQVRMSSNGASVNAGASETSVGDFTTLLLDINPGLTGTGYPTAWTQQTATVSGLPAPTSGRLAFRYFVTNGGPSGANSDFIGIDNVTYQKPALATCAFNTSSIKVDITGGTSPYTVVYSDGTTNRTVSGYVSGTPIQVTPGVTTTYTIVSVTGANGCAGSGNSGSAVITVTPPPAITTQPVNRTICNGQNTTFTVTATPPLGTTYQWQISTNGGTSYSNLTNAAPYSGVTTATLTVTGVTTALNLNRYRVVVTGVCPPNSVTSTGATLFVNADPTIVTQPVATTKCVGTAATFTVVASTPNGPVAPTYQWQVSINSGLTYTNIAGATSATLTIASVTQAMNNNLYQAVVTTAPCAATATSNAVKLTVNALPVVTIASPVTELIPGRTTTITATSTPTGTTYAWTRNGVSIGGPNTNTRIAGIDSIGTYRVTVTDNQTPGCTNSSNNLVIGTEASDNLWIYPNPTDGAFQVRLYFANPNVSENRVVSVWNANGQMVARKTLLFTRGMSPYSQVDFDLSKQAAGTYLVKVTEKNTERIVSGLVVIQ